MKEIKLNQEDSTKINSYISKYREIHDNINIVLKKVEFLIQEKEDLEKELVELRTSELEFNEYIKERYGEGSFDLATGKYKLK